MASPPSQIIGRQGNPSPSGGTTGLQKFDILSKFWVGLAGLVLSGTVGLSTIYFNRQAAERQAKTQIEALSMQRRASAAQLESSLLPVFARGSDAERQFALAILATVAPEEAARVGAILAREFRTATDQGKIERLISEAATQKARQDFNESLERASVYRQFALDANACREYFRAIEGPGPGSSLADSQELDLARKEYERGEFSSAANRLQRLLAGLR